MCSEKHWQAISENNKNFNNLGATNWLCPKIGENLTTYGRYTTEKAGGFQIMGFPCRNDTQPGKVCASPEEINNLF